METQVSKYIYHPLSQTANYAIIQLENSPKKQSKCTPAFTQELEYASMAVLKAESIAVLIAVAFSCKSS